MAAANSIVARLAQSAERCSQACAIVHGPARITYEDLWRQVASIAGYLEAEGLKRDDRVALIIENSIEYVAAYYGTLLAGGIVVPLNAAAKTRDFSGWLRHAEPSWIFAATDKSEINAAVCAGQTARVVHVGNGTPASAAAASFADIASADARLLRWPEESPGESPACILYTSGTTGAPKGVLLSHTNLASNTAAIVEYLGLDGDDSTVSVLPFFYSYGNSVLHTHLAVGGRVVIEDNLVFPHVVVERMANERVTGFAGVPSTYELLLRRVSIADYDLSALRYLTQAGGPMSPALTQRLRSALPDCRLFVMYGQTEATARLTYLPPERLDDKLGSVGIPIPGVEVVVRRDDGATADANEIGEVWAHGPNVMMGYWRDAAATTATVQSGWLKTGDAGYQDHDGYLYLVGRRSDIIKTGAYRVFPKDVEDVAMEIPGVAEVAVVGVDDDILGQAIKAFIVPMAGATLDPMRIRAYLREHLAIYKVPKHLELVAELPKTSSGKVRRRLLSEGNHRDI